MMKSQVCFCGFKQDQESSYQVASDQLGRKYTTHAKVTITNCLYMHFRIPMLVLSNLMSKRPHWQWSLGSQSTQMAWDVWEFFGTQQGSTENSRPSQPRTCLRMEVSLVLPSLSNSTGILQVNPSWQQRQHENSRRSPHIIDVKVLSCSMSIFLRSGMWNVFFLLLSLQSPLGISLINHCHSQLVGGFIHFEKYESNWIISPIFGGETWKQRPSPSRSPATWQTAGHIDGFAKLPQFKPLDCWGTPQLEGSNGAILLMACPTRFFRDQLTRLRLVGEVGW